MMFHPHTALAPFALGAMAMKTTLHIWEKQFQQSRKVQDAMRNLMLEPIRGPRNLATAEDPILPSVCSEPSRPVAKKRAVRAPGKAKPKPSAKSMVKRSTTAVRKSKTAQKDAAAKPRVRRAPSTPPAMPEFKSTQS